MRNILNIIEKNRNTKKKALIIFIVLSFLVEIFTISFLIRPAYSMVNKADCGVIEHIHTSECYLEHKNYGESVLVCSSDSSLEMLSHIHDDFCYDQNDKIICPLLEYQHDHTDDCYDEDGVQICGAAYHQHGEECFRVLGENESALVLECGKAFHVHAESCYPMLSPAPVEVMQESFEETQYIEPDFEEIEVAEPEMEVAETEIKSDEPANDSEIALFLDENVYSLTENNITSTTLEYKDENGTWVIVTDGTKNVPANTNMRIEVGYKVGKNDIVNNNKTIVYDGIPTWMNPNSTAEIYDKSGTKAAVLSVGDGKAVITFTDEYLSKFSDNTNITGTFSVEGVADWREIQNITGDVNLPSLDVNFTFEGNLPAKYGNFKIEKHNSKTLVEVKDDSGKLHTYLKYELKVISNENDISIPDICITDVLSAGRLNISDVIVGNGYVGIDGTATQLGNNSTNYYPYETITYAENHIPEQTINGTVVLENNNLKWKIANLQAGEERTLTYYVELNERYVGSGSAGTLYNAATPKSGDYERETARDEFTPKAEVNITKAQDWENVSIDPSGNGTIKYTVTVTANQNNSYTITDACIKDAFGSGMGNYVVAEQYVGVTITKGNTTETKNIQINSGGFDVPIDELKPGETVTITYSLEVQHLYSYTNGDVSISNNASFISKDNNGKLKHGYTFKGSGATTTISHNKWMRKMNGDIVDTERNISFNGNDVYNYCENSDDTPTKKTGITEFTVPKNAQEYTVIVNEDGTWNMSGAQFNDQFSDDRIKYTGYLKIEEFDKISNDGLNENKLLTELNKHTPTKTVWVDINGKNGFSINPQKYDLTDSNKVYLLTYYAAVDPSETNIKNIVVSNGFTVTGTIGYGTYTIRLNGVKMVVESTLVGSASYDFDKESIFYEKNLFSKGEIYWVIRANGTLPKGLHIQDRPKDNSMLDNSLVGVYMGDKGYDFSEITSSEELNAALSQMTELERGTNSYFYNIQTISSLSQLDGHGFAIFAKKEDPNASDGGSGYMMKSSITSKDGYKGVTGVHLANSPSIACDTDVMTTEIVQTWWFELVPNETDKFYIYYKDSSDKKHYLHITAQDDVSISDTPSELTVSLDVGRIIIKNSQGTALNWYGGSANSKKCFSAWGNGSGQNNKLYLGTLDKYKYKPKTISSASELDGQQVAIVTPGDVNSGLLVGGNSGDDALTGKWYTTGFSGNPPTEFIRTSQLQKWTFKRIGETDEFYVYYEDSNKQKHYLKLGKVNDNRGLATTSTAPFPVKVIFKDGKIKIYTVVDSTIYALDWFGGGQGSQNYERYAAWRDSGADDTSNNRLHYVAEEEIIPPDLSDSSNFDYSWSAQNNYGSVRINSQIAIDTDKSVYIVLRSQPNQALEGYFSKTFGNEVGIKDDASDQFDMLDRADYIYHPNLPLRKEGMVAAYWDGTNWTIKSERNVNKNLSSDRDTISKLRFNSNANYTPGLYVEWLLNVNWDGTIETIDDEYVILTDHLNNKMEPVSVKQFYLGETSKNNPPDYTKPIPELEVNPDWAKYDTHGIPFYYNEKTGELKLAVSKLCKAAVENSSVVNLQLICRVTDPNVIFSGDVSELANKADLTRSDGTFIGEHSDTHVIKQAYSISKTSIPPKDEKTNQYTGNTNKLEYTIVINPRAEDLIIDGDTLPVLIDEMSDNMELIGDIEVIKKVGDVETKLNNIKYSTGTLESERKKQIIFDNLPDKTHLIIKYKTKVKINQNQSAQISNIAYWKGYGQPSTPQQSGSFSYALNGSVDANQYPVVVINKRDFDNNNITLGGAQFEIREVDTSGTVGNLLFTTPITDQDGKITINSGLAYNKVYQLKETDAPTDYVLDEKPTYFMIIAVDENGNENHGYNINNGKMTIGNEVVDVMVDYAGQDNIDLEMTIYNKKARVQVNKVFLDESDKEIARGDVKFYGTYRFGLYHNLNEKPVQILSITYSETGISYALDGKATNAPEFTKARASAVNYIYELNEKGEPITDDTNAYLNGYSFDVTYSAISVVPPQQLGLADTPTVTVTNKYHPIYMPSAGGIGLKKYYKIAFFALMILATLTAAVFRVRRKHK